MSKKCDQCGREIRAGEGSFSTSVERPNFETVANPGYTRMESLTICNACRERRKTTQRVFICALVLVIAGLAVATILVRAQQ